VDDFAAPLRSLLDRLRDEKRMLVLILDDIDGLADLAEFSNWLKRFIERAATSGQPLPLCLLIVGVEDRRQRLIEHQPSRNP
jgi:hypothetical protein